MVTLYIVMQANRGPSISHGGFAPQPQAHKEKSEANGRATSPEAERTSQANGSSETNGVPTTTSKKGSSILYPQKVIFGAPYGLAKKQEEGNDVVRGTGGTDLIPFLRQCKFTVPRLGFDQTRRVMTNGQIINWVLLMCSPVPLSLSLSLFVARDETNETKIVPTPAISKRKRSFGGF
jgi:hypothetical protein